MLREEIEVHLTIELYGLAPNTLEHAQCFCDVLLAGIGFEVILLEIIVEAGMYSDNPAKDEVIRIGILAEERFLAGATFDLSEQAVLSVIHEA